MFVKKKFLLSFSKCKAGLVNLPCDFNEICSSETFKAPNQPLIYWTLSLSPGSADSIPIYF